MLHSSVFCFLLMEGKISCCLHSLIPVCLLCFSGADVHARDPRRRMSPQEWAAYTGRLEAVRLMQRLLERPCPEQFGEKYKPELPLTPAGVQKSTDSKNCLQRLAEFVRSALPSRSRPGMEDGGVLDHMVKMTTSLYSPAVAIACQTVCPENLPCVGKRRLAVQEILEVSRVLDTGAQERSEERSLPSPRLPVGPRKASLFTLPLPKRSSVRPGVVIPRVRISKAPAPTFQPERVPAKGSTKDSTHLQLPKWRYKEAKEEKRKAEEAERQRVAAAQKERRVAPWRKRT